MKNKLNLVAVFIWSALAFACGESDQSAAPPRVYYVDLKAWHQTVAELEELAEITSTPDSTFLTRWYWSPPSKGEGWAPSAPVGHDKFLTSRRVLPGVHNPTYWFEEGIIPGAEDMPDTYTFVRERKLSDSLFFYNFAMRHGTATGMNYDLYPIAVITPTGEVMPMGDLQISNEYIFNEVSKFMQDFEAAQNEGKELVFL